MAACRLCGYQSPVGVVTLSECPVCGEPCDPSDGRDGADVESGQGVEHAGDGVSRGTSPLKTQPPWIGAGNASAFPSSCLNPELQSLLCLVPEEQNRKTRAQEAVRAAGGALVPSFPDEGQSGPDVVYIRPRVDPGMRVLKGRYNTQPRVAKATSMSVLERLAHPLMGYDSREALAPKARRLRQESVERLLRKTLAGGKANCADRPPWLLSRTSSSVELTRAYAKGARSRRSNSGFSIASAVSRPHLTTSVNAAHCQQPGGASVRSLLQQRDCEHDEHATNREEPAACEAREFAKESSGVVKEPRGSPEEPGGSTKDKKDSPKKEFPLFHLRASEKRRAKPSLRRKRVATMRSVNGWVRNADPASTRREVSLDRRVIALTRSGKRVPSSQPKVSASNLGKYGSKQGSSRASNGAFLTEVDSNGNPFVETRRGRGDGVEHSIGGGPGSNRGAKRRGSGKTTNKGKPFRVDGSDLRRRNQCDSNARGAGGRYGSAELGRRAQQRSGPTLDRGQAGGARTVPVAAPQRQRHHGRRDGTRGGGGATEQAQGMAEQRSTSQNGELAERDERVGNVDARDAAATAATAATAVDVGGRAPSDPREALDTARVWDREDGTLTGKGAPREFFSQGDPDAPEVGGSMAPAWDNSRSQSTPMLDARVGARLAWDFDGPTPTGSSRSAWQLLRGAETDVPSQMKMLLQSFEDKVAARVAAPPAHDPPSPHHRLPTPVIADSHKQQRAASTPLPEGGRHRHRRPLSRGDKPPSESRLEGAFIHRQPAPKGWVHRQSLPSLLTDRAGPQPSSNPSTPTTALAGAVATRLRGKSRPTSEGSTATTWMQRLDGHYATVGDAWDGRRSGTDRRDSGGRKTANGSKGLLLRAAAVPPIVSGMLQAEGAEVGAVSRGGRTGAFDGKKSPNGISLAAAVPRPLLYVGSGTCFKL